MSKYNKLGKIQFAIKQDDSKELDTTETARIQSIVGSFLYYGRAIDIAVLEAINKIARQQPKPTEYTKRLTAQLLDYLNTYPNAHLRFYASDMVLHAHSDATYLVQPGAKSIIAVYCFLSDDPRKTPHPTIPKAILVQCKTLRHVVSLAAEAETVGFSYNVQTSLPIRLFLEALQYPQPPTPITMDNSTMHGFVHNNINQKQSKMWDMRMH